MPMNKSGVAIGGAFIAAACLSAFALFGFGRGDAPPTIDRPAPAAQTASQAPADFIRAGLREPKPRTPGAIRLATYNVENLFKGGDDAKPESELVALAETLRRIDADVVALQEVESDEALRWFLDRHASDLGYEHVISLDAGDQRGIEQSFISRFPLSNPRQWLGELLGGEHPELYGSQPNWHAGEPIAFRRSPLMVDVTVPAGAKGNQEPYRFTAITVHQKAGRFAAYWREAEARRIVEIIEKLEAEDPARNIVLLGDFNAQTWDDSVQLYLDAGLIDLFGEEEPAESNVTHASDRRIDMILYNRAMASEIIPDTRFVLGTPVHPLGADWRNDPRPPGYAADHYPVVVDLWPIEGGR